MDFIFDWARDNYRQDILTGIRTLSRGFDGATSIIPDSDLMSTREIATSEPINHDTSEGLQQNEQIRSAFHVHDSSRGVVRHASLIESRFHALFITGDNVQTLLQSTDSHVVQRLARRVLAELADDVVSVDIDIMDALEEQWTGTARCSRSFSLMHTKFFMAVTFATYLTPSWDQVRELSIIAVAEDAFDLLVEASGLVAGKGKAQRPIAYSLERGVLTRAISDFQAIRPDHSLLGAIRRTSFRFRSSTTGELAIKYNDGTLRRTVHYVYSSFKRGVLEPSESFLRVSSCYERLLQNTDDNSPYFISEDLQISAWDIVLVTGGGPSTGARTSSTCAYVLGESVEAPVTADLAVAIKKTLENHDVYHTTRDNGSASFWAGSKAERAPWNIRGVYGFCRKYELFVA